MSTAEPHLKIELGRAAMPLEDLVGLRAGSLVPLDRRVEDLVDVVVEGRLVARGEVVIVDKKFCVRVRELGDRMPPAEGANSRSKD
jgi:flagellar motor switch protein FliN/FliY